MMNFDFSPFYGSTIGFDRLFRLLENNVGSDWPPYNIEKTGENDYRIAMALAGFGPEDVELVQHGNSLIVKGQVQPQASDKREVLHEGTSLRSFEQTFKLADYVTVVSAKLENGLLVVSLKRDVPEAMKPRQIAIEFGDATAIRGEPAQLERGPASQAA